MRLQLLDCTLRDGAYVVDGKFGSSVIIGIIRKLQEANIDIIECGWLKNASHEEGTSYYHVPSDLERYLTTPKKPGTIYTAMIDYNRYDCSILPEYDGKSIDAIRVVFPVDHFQEGLSLVAPIREKGYKVYLQAANTLGYSDFDLLKMIEGTNKVQPDGLSIVDTFGAMYPDDLERFMILIDNNLDKNISLGFHSHNNQQLSFALCMSFIQHFKKKLSRDIVVDGTLCGMGRGAGNACTELLVHYINKGDKTYDIDKVLDTIDVYMSQFLEDKQWEYSVPYFLAGMYGCHVNNVIYLTREHRVKNKDMRSIFNSLSKDKRIQYDYDNLEKIYIDYQSKNINDSNAKEYLIEKFRAKNIVTILPGESSAACRNHILQTIKNQDAVSVGINAILPGFTYDYMFFTNLVKYEYAKENYPEVFSKAKVIVTSNIMQETNNNNIIINYNDLAKTGWKYFENSMIMFLRLMHEIVPKEIMIAGFDGFNRNEDNYAEQVLRPPMKGDYLEESQNEISEMFSDFLNMNHGKITISFITKSPYEKLLLFERNK